MRVKMDEIERHENAKNEPKCNIEDFNGKILKMEQKLYAER